jgi:hypothetical protein
MKSDRVSEGFNESAGLEEAADTGPTRVTYRNAVYDIYPDGRVVSATGEVPADTPWYESVVNQANRIKAAVPRMGTVGFQDTSQGAPEAPTKVGRYFVYPEGRVVHTTGVEVRADTDMKRELIEAAKRIKAESAGEEELAVGVEAIVEGLITDTISQAELESLIKELEEKFTQEKVQQALVLAMSQQQQ